MREATHVPLSAALNTYCGLGVLAAGACAVGAGVVAPGVTGGGVATGGFGVTPAGGDAYVVQKCRPQRAQTQNCCGGHGCPGAGSRMSICAPQR
jgi:hypothetical protein